MVSYLLASKKKKYGWVFLLFTICCSSCTLQPPKLLDKPFIEESNREQAPAWLDAPKNTWSLSGNYYQYTLYLPPVEYLDLRLASLEESLRLNATYTLLQQCPPTLHPALTNKLPLYYKELHNKEGDNKQIDIYYEKTRIPPVASYNIVLVLRILISAAKTSVMAPCFAGLVAEP